MHNSNAQLDKARQSDELRKLESSIEASPASAQAMRSLFKMYEEHRWVERASRAYQKLLGRILPDSGLYVLHLGMARVYHASGQAAQSLEAIEKAIALNRANREAYDFLLKVHEDNDSLMMATKTLQGYALQQPNNAELHSVLAKTYGKLGWWAEARDAAKTAYNLNAKLGETLRILSEAESRLRSNPKLFQETAGRCKAVDDVEGMLRNWLAWAEATRQADHYVVVGELCEQYGQLGRAESAFNQALGLPGDHRSAHRGLERVRAKKRPPVPLNKPRYSAKELEQLFQWFLKLGDMRGAVDFLQRYAERYPRFVPGLYFLASAYREAGQLDESARCLEQAIEKSHPSRKSDLYCKLGVIYLEQKKMAQAKRAFRSALRYAPNHEHAEATRRLDDLAAKEVPPLDVLRVKWEEFSDEWEKSGDPSIYEETLKYFRGLVNLDPSIPHLHIYIGLACEKLGRIEQAYQEHRKAAVLFYTDDAFVRLGKFCAIHDLKAEAAQAYELALKINQRNEGARSGFSEFRNWITTKEAPFQPRAGKPDGEYLYAIWELARRENPPSQVAKYLVALTDVLPDEPTLFRLLGQSYQEYHDPRSAAFAYRHEAALRGTASDYVWLGNFCFEQKLDAMAVEAYQVALELNPFCHQAAVRLTAYRPAQFSATFITGDPDRENLAHYLCENLDDPFSTQKAQKLRIGFIESKSVECAEATYRHLQAFHPEHPAFAQDLVQVYLSCGRPQLAWLEANRVLSSGAISKDSRATFEALKCQAEQDMLQAGQEQPSLPVESTSSLGHLSPTISIDWDRYRLKLAASQETFALLPTQLIQQAEKCLDEALQVPMDKLAPLNRFLEATYLYQRAGRHDLATDCLVDYGQALARYYHVHGKSDQAQALTLEAMQLTMSRSADVLGRQARLMNHVLDCLDGLEKQFGLPRQWAAPIHAKARALLSAGASLALPRLSNLLGLVATFLQSFQQLTQDFQGPAYCAAIIRQRIGTILQQNEQDRLLVLLERWLAEPTRSAEAIPNRAHVEISLPSISTLPRDAQELELQVEVRNAGPVPADCVQVALTVGPDSSVREPQQIIPFLPGGATQTAIFHLTDIREQHGYTEFKLDLSYFDPVEKQDKTLRAAYTLLQRTERPFRHIENPYRTSWSPGLPFQPEYIERLQIPQQRLQWIDIPAQHANIEWTQAALERAIDLTGGERVTLEILGYNVVEHLNQLRRAPPVAVFVPDVESAADAMINDRELCPHFIAIVEDSKLTGADKLILACLAAKTENDAGWVLQADLQQDLERWGISMSEAALYYLQTQLPLIQAEELPSRTHRYRLTIRLLRAWLRKYWQPPLAAEHLRQLRQKEQRKLVSTLREKLGDAIAWRQACREVETRYTRAAVDFYQFTQLKREYTKECYGLLSEVRESLINKGFTDGHSLLSRVMEDAPEHLVREALQVSAHRRQWDETQIKQRLGEGGDILVQITDFILDVVAQGLDKTMEESVTEQVDLAGLRRRLVQYFSESELRDLCFDLGVDYEILPGDEKGAKARELIVHFERQGRTSKLVERCRQLRPNFSWPGMPRPAKTT